LESSGNFLPKLSAEKVKISTKEILLIVVFYVVFSTDLPASTFPANMPAGTSGAND